MLHYCLLERVFKLPLRSLGNVERSASLISIIIIFLKNEELDKWC